MNKKRILEFSVGPVGGAILGFVSLPVMAWAYSAEDIGRLSLLQVFVGFFVVIFALGLDQAYVREYHESESRPALLKMAVLPGLVPLLIVLLGCLLVSGELSAALFSLDNATLGMLVVAGILTSYLSRFLSLVLRMQERGLAFSVWQILPKIIFLLMIGLYFLLSSRFDFLHLVLAYVVSVFITTIICAWGTRQEWLQALHQPMNREELKVMLRFGMPLVLSALALWGATSVDRLFLRQFATFEQLGIYSVANSLAAVGMVLQSVFSTVWAPTVYRWVAEDVNLEKVDQVREYVLAAVIAIFALAGLFSWVVTWVLPAVYNDVQYLTVACLAYPLFYTLSETTVVGIAITRRSGYATAAAVIALLASVLGNYLLVPRLGAGGAAISTAAGLWLFLVCRTEFSSRLWRPIPRMKLYTTTLLALLSAIAFVLYGEKHPFLMTAMWLGLLVVMAVAFRKTLRIAASALLGERASSA